MVLPLSLAASTAGPGAVKVGIEVYFAISAEAAETSDEDEAVLAVLFVPGAVVAEDADELELPQAAATNDKIPKLPIAAIDRLFKFLILIKFPS